jgi:hypothetical protein
MVGTERRPSGFKDSFSVGLLVLMERHRRDFGVVRLELSWLIAQMGCRNSQWKIHQALDSGPRAIGSAVHPNLAGKGFVPVLSGCHHLYSCQRDALATVLGLSWPALCTRRFKT